MKSTVLFLMLSVLFLACSETTPDNTVQDNTADMPPAEANQAANESDIDIQAIVEAYLDVKESLVNSNAEDAQQAAESLVQQLQKEGNLQLAAEKIAASQELEEQRKHFETLSNELYAVAKEAQELPRALYWQYCPMAFNNKGASWLSGEEEIMNPYFGDKMLKCGSVKETLE